MDPKSKPKEPPTSRTVYEDTQRGGLSSDDDDEAKQERMKRVKMQMSKRAEEKTKRAEEIRKKKEGKAGGKKDKKQGWKDKLQFIAKIFSGKKAEKVKKKALSNIANKNVGNVNEGDITFKGGETDLKVDVWIEEPSVLINTQHRDNLNLVKNNDNDGHLFHENKRPFWKNPVFAKEHPPIPEQKPSSVLLVQVVNEGKQLAETVEAPDNFDWTENFTDLIARDERHFRNEQMLANTIRSVINTMFDEKDLRQQASTDREANKPTEAVRIMEPPAEQTLYSRHHWEQQRKDVFKKSLPGKPRKK